MWKEETYLLKQLLSRPPKQQNDKKPQPLNYLLVIREAEKNNFVYLILVSMCMLKQQLLQTWPTAPARQGGQPAPRSRKNSVAGSHWRAAESCSDPSVLPANAPNGGTQLAKVTSSTHSTTGLFVV